MKSQHVRLNSRNHGPTVPFHIRRRLEQELEILALGQEHGDEGGGPEGDEQEFENQPREVEEVAAEGGAEEVARRGTTEEGGKGQGEG